MMGSFNEPKYLYDYEFEKGDALLFLELIKKTDEKPNKTERL